MAIRDDFAPGEVLAAADLNDTFGSKLNLAGGKILQVVRATDSTNRTTTSTSYVDVTGMTVSITPQKSDSAVLIVACFIHQQTFGAAVTRGYFRIADSSNNGISGATDVISGFDNLNAGHQRNVVLIAYATPATTSSVTYKLRFYTENASSTAGVRNDSSAGQMYAIEVSA
jgi:hypothetical protein